MASYWNIVVCLLSKVSSLFVLITLAFAPAMAQQEPVTNAVVSATELMRQVVDNEVKANENENLAFMYRLRSESPSGSKTKELIETKDGTVARLIALNDKPLTLEQRAQDDRRLEYLLSHPEEQQRKIKEQKQDADRVKRMFKQLPDAFRYEYDGTEPSKHGQVIRLKFRPNPDYDPPSREMAVFKGMEGTVWVDASSVRLVKIEGHLFRDVNFGWGLLGHLDKGGHFIVEQNNIGGGQWEQTKMDVEFNGKALIFKTINLKELETAWDFRPVPPRMSLAQGVEMLKKTAPVLAENQNTPTEQPKQ